MPRSAFTLGRREGRVHATILASVLWLVAAALLLKPGPADPFGKVKFPDFVHFYVLGDLARTRDFGQLYDAEAQYRRQVQLVPTSVSERFVPVYGPQTAVMFLPFSVLPYWAAATAWALLTVFFYALSVAGAWRSVQRALPDAWFVALAAAGFPPFWNLVLHGQTTAVPLIAFFLAWKALGRGRSFLGGLALGLLAVKPQFGPVLAVVTLVCGEWALVGGAVTSVVIQGLVAYAVTGPGSITDYFAVLQRLPEMTSALEPKPYQMHSLRALTQLLPDPLASVCFWLGTLIVAVYAASVWRRPLPISLRLSTVILATCLVSPHLTIYDATVLALPLIWIGGWVGETNPPLLGDRYWRLVYCLFASFLIPTAVFLRIQVSVLILAAIFWHVVRALTPERPGSRRPEDQNG